MLVISRKTQNRFNKCVTQPDNSVIISAIFMRRFGLGVDGAHFGVLGLPLGPLCELSLSQSMLVRSFYGLAILMAVSSSGT